MYRQLLVRFVIVLLLVSLLVLPAASPVLAASPPNDDFDHATLITALPYSSVQQLSEATRAPDDPFTSCDNEGKGKTVWYHFIADQDMVVEVLLHSSLPSAASSTTLYSGDQPGSLSEYRCKYWDDPVPFQVDVQAGSHYSILISAEESINEPVTLEVNQVPAPPNDDFDYATVITTLPYSNTQDATAATRGHDDPTSCTAQKNVWYAFTPSRDMRLKAQVIGRAEEINIFTGVRGELESVHCFRPIVSPILAEAGVTYYFMVNNIYYDYPSSITFTLEEVFPPGNDDFENALVIESLPFTDWPDLTGASGDLEDDMYTCSPSTPKSVWYMFTPAEDLFVEARAHLDDGAIIVMGDPNGQSEFDETGPWQWVQFWARTGQTYHIVICSAPELVRPVEFNLFEVLPPANDDFASSESILGLPFEERFGLVWGTAEMGEPVPSCWNSSYPLDSKTIWYRYTPVESSQLMASVAISGSGNYFFPTLSFYSGPSLDRLTELGCRFYDHLIADLEAGTTYYFQVTAAGGSGDWHGKFQLEIARPITAAFYPPFEPSIFDTIPFTNLSEDPAHYPMTAEWDFGDGVTSTDWYAIHQYRTDGDYLVTLTVTTEDGRSASSSQVVPVWTHDVGVLKLNAPGTARAGQTKQVLAFVSSRRYPETVQLDLYKVTPQGEIWVGSQTMQVVTQPDRRTTLFKFEYTFQPEDALAGEVIFKAYANIVETRDALPDDNQAVSKPVRVRN